MVCPGAATPTIKSEILANLWSCRTRSFAIAGIPINSANWDFGIWSRRDFKMPIKPDAFVAAIYFRSVRVVYHPDVPMVPNHWRNWPFCPHFWICANMKMIEIKRKHFWRENSKTIFIHFLMVSLYFKTIFPAQIPILELLTIHASAQRGVGKW